MGCYWISRAGIHFGFGSAGVEWYVAEGFALGFRVDLAGIELAEMTEYAFGGGPAFSMRWHFLRRESWTLFADASIGLLWTDREVPDGASNLNFTPRLSIGGTIALSDDVRFIGAIGWSHVSNAQTSGFNPGFDALRVNVGLTFGF